MHNLMVCIPSARGVHPHTMSCLFNARTILEKHGHRMHLACVYRMPLDVARDILAAGFYYSKADVALLIDDDVQLEPWHAPEGIMTMLNAIDGGAPVVSAPCRMRSHEANPGWTPFNVFPNETMEIMNGVRLLGCDWTGLGAVMITHKVIEQFYDCTDIRRYRTEGMPGKELAHIFGSTIEEGKQFQADAEGNVLLLDDRVMSLRMKRLGIPIYASIDVPTCHDGMAGCMGQEMERHARRQAAEKAATQGKPLLGADGRPLPGGAR